MGGGTKKPAWVFLSWAVAIINTIDYAVGFICARRFSGAAPAPASASVIGLPCNSLSVV
jgi:hypothetical protein